MPLKKGFSPETIAYNRRLLIREGRPAKQALAIALKLAQEAREKAKKKKHDFLIVQRVDQETTVPNKKVPPGRFPMGLAVDYALETRKLFKSWYKELKQEIEINYFPRLDSLEFKQDDIFDDFVAKWRVLVAGGFSQTITTIGTKVNSVSQRTFKRQVKTVFNIDIFSGDPWLQEQLDQFTKQNVQLITNIGEQTVQRVEAVVNNAVISGISTKELAKQLNQIENFGVNRANLIVRDQVGKFLGITTQLRQQDFNIDRYEWSDSGDNRVRKTHIANDGKIFKWNEPPAITGHPGNDIQCRCTAIPVFIGSQFDRTSEPVI